MTRSEGFLLTLLVLLVGLTVLVICLAAMSHGAQHDQLGSVISQFQGGSR